MKTNTYVRNIRIHQDLFNIKHFLAKTANLVRWTHFFQRLIKEVDNICQFDTALGVSKTQVHLRELHDKSYFIIESLFLSTGHKEEAMIVLENSTNPVCEFQLKLPTTLSQEKIDRQLNFLTQELKTLKQLLEETI